jgi:hypothetical protein
LEYILFRNDHEDVARQLRTLIKEIPAAHTTLQIFLLDENEKLSGVTESSKYQITSSTLENILREHDLELERQDNLIPDE